MGTEPEAKAKQSSETLPPKPRIAATGLIRCPVCGNKLAAGAMYCRKCGKVFIVNTATVLTGVIVVTMFFLALISLAISSVGLALGLLLLRLLS